MVIMIMTVMVIGIAIMMRKIVMMMIIKWTMITTMIRINRNNQLRSK